jgi:diguanylate cyclase (GGDEF)-like protein
VTKIAQLALIAVILTFVGAASYISVLIFDRQAVLAKVSRYNMQWSASQAIIELTRLQQVVASTAIPGARVDAGEARLRYDILVNRMSLLRGGEFFLFLQQDHALLQAADEARKAIHDIEPLINLVDVGDNASRILERLAPFTSKFISIAASANRFGGEQVAKYQSELLTLHWMFSAMVIGLILCGIALIGFLIWHNGLLREAHARLRKATDQLRETSVSRAFLDAALNNMSQGLCVFDAKQRLIVSNPQFSSAIGLPQAAARPGSNLDSLIEIAARDDLPDALHLLKSHRNRIDANKATSDFEVLPSDRFISVSHQPMAGGGWVATFEDVTERKRNEARIEHMAKHDALTGLPNRLRFREEIERAVKHLRRKDDSIAVLCLDLDHFKSVNDTLGHPIGDGLLCAVSDRLRSSIRPKDTPARLGGDEFAIVQIADNQPMAAVELGESLVKALSEPYLIDDHQVIIGASVGIAFSRDMNVDPDALLKNADLALYSAKSGGRGNHKLFEPKMAERAKTRRQLELDLHNALAEEEFELAYQPLINVRTGGIVTLEALLRWHHPVRGLLQPNEFIAVAEEIGLTDHIGEWVLKTACREALAWPGDVRIAVNVSPMQFKTKRLVHAVKNALNASGLNPQRLELEITESVLLLDTDATLATLNELRRIGVSIAMDDFGTGFSSLSCLKNFPFDKITIDKSFVRDMTHRDHSHAIVRAVTSLGKGLGMVTTAEGVETHEQLEHVRAEGCLEAQGFLFSRPLSAEQVLALFRTMIEDVNTAA